VPVAPDLVGRARRDVERSLLRAKNGLKLLGGGFRRPSGLAAKDVVWSYGKVELWRYQSETRTVPLPLLIVPSLVSKSYVFDLEPGNSFVEFMLGRGFDVFLVDWGAPDEEESTNTLETYCDEHLPDAVRAVCAASGAASVTMFAYCFGGVLALLYAAAHPDDPVSALAVMATPVDFSALGAMTALLRRTEPHDLLDDSGNVPPEVVRDSFKLVQPTGSANAYASLWQHLWKDEFVASHQLMTQWAGDHVPFPGACFVQVTHLLGRQNRLFQGRVPWRDRTLDLRDIVVPFLSVVAENDQFVSVPATGNVGGLVGSADTSELRFRAGHVGLIAGRGAHARNLPQMADWLETHSGGRATDGN
jgi:polyhydroxyalkanoate synthase